ncbi:unnamed protein product [Phytomonas sp. EM1]|nr:unnamed protein product [Phytomonas sp. EM1]|eukprot:CCW61108.1 unnamed protein product [Phytomonas sp. isolate EM1]
MFRRAAYLLHLTTVISKTSYVSIFPIHLDPPTLQHREIFKLLLGTQEESTKEHNIPETYASSSKETLTGLEDGLKSSSEDKSAFGRPSSHSTSQDSCRNSLDMDSPQQERMQRHQRPSRSLVLPKYEYMEPFARSIQNHSQLAPFEDIILVPNTRYPISLSQSTNLAALTVLAVRGLPHVHVDFTALEHPDASMPIIYELTQRYPNCVLVHWLHDAYEMQRWKNFNIIKQQVPMMLLKTISLPVSMFPKRPYSSPKDYSNGDWTAGYDDGARDDIRGRQFPDPDSPPPDESSTMGHEHKASSVCEDLSKTKLQLEGDNTLATYLKDSKVLLDPNVKGNQPTTDQNYANQREWWMTRDSHGDDNIEVSKSYYNSGSFSWLGATPQTNPTIGWDSIDVVDVDPHYYTHGPYICKHGALKCEANPLHLMRNSKGLDTYEDGRVKAVVEAKDILVSSDGFVKIVHEDCKINNRDAPCNVVSDSKKAHNEKATDIKTEQLGINDLESILLKIPSTPLTSSPPTLSAHKELAQVKHELRNIFSAVVLPSSPETFQPHEESNSTKVCDIHNFHNTFYTENEGPRHMETYGRGTRRDNRISGHHKIPEHLRLVPFQNAQRNVRELLEELYQPLNYHQNHNHTMVTCHTNLSKDNSLVQGYPFTDSERSGLSQMDHAQVSGKSTSSSINMGRDASTGCGHGATSSNVESRRLPVVEVHSVIRTTGADVRQALWEQEIDPIHILSDCVLRYIDSYMLYRDSRKVKTNVDLRQYQPGLRSPGFLGASPAARSTHMGSGDVSSVGGARRLPLSKTGGCMHSSHRNITRVFFESIIPRLELHYDKNNPIAREKFEALKVFQVLKGEEPDLIVPVGGDGYMMHCIRKNWRRFIPFYGVNAGHVGYLLNDCSALEDLFLCPLMMNSTNMLYCQAEKETKKSERVLLSEMAFNDAWVERSSGQSAFIRILVNGEERIKGLRADGVLVSTAAGSTAYSRAVGASPIPVGVPLIQVVGSNVVSPSHWQPVHLNQEDVVEFEVLDHVKRPCRCFVDAVNLGNILRMQVRSSRVAGVTLAFSNSCDLQQKLFQMQFPKMD